LVAEAKKIRTRRGAMMMFVTIDDVEGQVEALIMGRVMETAEAALERDSVVLVTGRLDHQEGGQTKLIAQEVSAFDPSDEEIARARRAAGNEPVIVRVDAAGLDRQVVPELKSLFESFPGGSEVVLEMVTREGPKRLRFGDSYRVKDSEALHAELEALLGSAVVKAA